MILDATNTILGRIATYAAKKSLLGETIDVINCEKAIIAGNKKEIIARYTQKMNRGTHKGPFLHRAPDKIVKRTIRGMLPYKQPKGSDALKKIKCYKGVPPEFEGKKTETLKKAQSTKLPNMKYMTVELLSKQLGGKVW